ncbi:SPOSA6832_00900, partial [Sporobolomyces salmonicolor]
MPPRRSTRATNSIYKTDVDLTKTTSPEPSPPKPAKRPRFAAKSKAGDKSKTGMTDDKVVIQPDDSIDAALARKLQVGEDGIAGSSGNDEEQRLKCVWSGKPRALGLRVMLHELSLGSFAPAEHPASPWLDSLLTSNPVASTSSGRRTSSRKKAASPPFPLASAAQPPPANDPTDPKNILQEHRNLFLSEGKCPCGSTLLPPKSVRFPNHRSRVRADHLRNSQLKLQPTSTSAEFLALGAANCKKCKKKICRGCWQPVQVDGQCCAAGRAIILSALDTVYLADHLKKPVVKPAAAAKGKGRKKTKPDGRGAGTGYGTDAAYPYGGHASASGPSNGTGYARVRQLRRRGRNVAAASASPPKKVENQHEIAQDKLYLPALKLLARLLPQPDSPEATMYDFFPHSTLPALLSVSTLPDLLANLLRNDSVLEWQRRSDVYFAMIEVLQGLGHSEATLAVLFEERRDKAWSEGLGKWLRGEGDIVWERTKPAVVAGTIQGKGRGKKRKVDEEASVELGELILASPLFSLLKKLTIQAEAFRKAALTGEFDDDDAALVGICGDFVSAGERCASLSKLWMAHQDREKSPREGGHAKAAEPVINGRLKGKGKEKEASGWTEKDYVKACAALAYQTVEMSVDSPEGGKTFPTHHYKRDIDDTASSRRPHNSFVHLAKELAVLSTSLPPGIWLRVDEARVDVLKCLIAGPEGTPYSGGLFEFDIFIPLQYPQVSPTVWLKTTGDGRVRFNPNLYAEGKVCLSLLGTWAGAPASRARVLLALDAHTYVGMH